MPFVDTKMMLLKSRFMIQYYSEQESQSSVSYLTLRIRHRRSKKDIVFNLFNFPDELEDGAETSKLKFYDTVLGDEDVKEIKQAALSLQDVLQFLKGSRNLWNYDCHIICIDLGFLEVYMTTGHLGKSIYLHKTVGDMHVSVIIHFEAEYQN